MNSNIEADVRAFNTALGRVLRAQRTLRGKGQADMVDDDARLSLATVGRIERGAGATTVQLISLAGALGMPLSEFIAAVEAEAARQPVQPRGVVARTNRRRKPANANPQVDVHDSTKDDPQP